MSSKSEQIWLKSSHNLNNNSNHIKQLQMKKFHDTNSLQQIKKPWNSSVKVDVNNVNLIKQVKKRKPHSINNINNSYLNTKIRPKSNIIKQGTPSTTIPVWNQEYKFNECIDENSTTIQSPLEGLLENINDKNMFKINDITHFTYNNNNNLDKICINKTDSYSNQNHNNDQIINCENNPQFDYSKFNQKHYYLNLENLLSKICVWYLKIRTNIDELNMNDNDDNNNNHNNYKVTINNSNNPIYFNLNKKYYELKQIIIDSLNQLQIMLGKNLPDELCLQCDISEKFANFQLNKQLLEKNNILSYKNVDNLCDLKIRKTKPSMDDLTNSECESILSTMDKSNIIHTNTNDSIIILNTKNVTNLNNITTQNQPNQIQYNNKYSSVLHNFYYDHNPKDFNDRTHLCDYQKITNGNHNIGLDKQYVRSIQSGQIKQISNKLYLASSYSNHVLNEFIKTNKIVANYDEILNDLMDENQIIDQNYPNIQIIINKIANHSHQEIISDYIRIKKPTVYYVHKSHIIILPKHIENEPSLLVKAVLLRGYHEHTNLNSNQINFSDNHKYITSPNQNYSEQKFISNVAGGDIRTPSPTNHGYNHTLPEPPKQIIDFWSLDKGLSNLTYDNSITNNNNYYFGNEIAANKIGNLNKQINNSNRKTLFNLINQKNETMKVNQIETGRVRSTYLLWPCQK